MLLVALLAGCAPLANLAPGGAAKAKPAGQLTIIYTGYGRGSVYPKPDCG
jgi:hypothetical protein